LSSVRQRAKKCRRPGRLNNRKERVDRRRSLLVLGRVPPPRGEPFWRAPRFALERDRANKIGATHNSDESAFTQDGRTFELVPLDQLRDFAEVRRLRNANDGRGHQLPGGAAVCLYRREKSGIERLALGEQRQPPLPSLFTIEFVRPSRSR
jgi:hypothetical protein